MVGRLELLELAGFDCAAPGGGALGRVRDDGALGGADAGGIVLWRALPELGTCGVPRVVFFTVDFSRVVFRALAAFLVEAFPSFISVDCAVGELRTSSSHDRLPVIFRIISVMT